MSLQYHIRVEKDHTVVTARWDIAVDISDAELISSFTLAVDGKLLDTQCSDGNKACNGVVSIILANADQDCPVSFAISTNRPYSRDGNDVLRGQKTFDDIDFLS